MTFFELIYRVRTINPDKVDFERIRKRLKIIS
jgi:hypothetical protein